jgi:hypothetical protein
MMLGLGQSSTTSTPTTNTSAPATFTNGLEAWENPGTALSSIGTIFQNASTAFTSQNLPVIAGLLLPPVAVLAILVGMTQGKARR